MGAEPYRPGVTPAPGGLPGEPGVTTDREPPFVADDEATRWLFSLNRFGIRPGLSRIRGLLAALDHPERQVPTLVVAGTNGKGSTTRILAALLHDAGYRVGCFTSPHLLRVHERIVIAERPVSAELLAAKVQQIRPAVETHAASWFEALTAITLDIAREQEVDFLCCETGLGGRLDATNALPAVATLLVSISRDHSRILGESLAEIAAEKLGLLKRGVPLFCGVGQELRSQVFAAAVAAGSPCYFLDELARWEDDAGGWRLTTRRQVTTGLPQPSSPVLQRNIALALLCLQELALSGVLRPPPAPAAALARLFLPGRFQTVLAAPDWICDTAHNTEALRLALDTYLARPCRGRRWVLFGCMQDKELGLEVGERLRHCDGLVVTPINLPRSRNRNGLQELLEGWQLPVSESVRVVPDVQAAILFLACELEPADTLLVTGSCFLVAELLYRLGYRELEETRRVRAAREVLPAAGLA